MHFFMIKLSFSYQDGSDRQILTMDQQDNSNIKLYILLTVVFLTLYVVFSALLDYKKLPIHRSTVAILVGIVAGLFIYLAIPDAYALLVEINEVIIFEVLFPPMVFAQGYTLRKGVFFKNIKYMFVFGFLGTFLSFLLTWGMIAAANSMHMVRDAKDFSYFRVLSDWQILLFAACISSIDPGTSEEAVSSVQFPRLFSVIFGEQLLNGSITIVMFQAILNLQDESSYDSLVLYWYTFFSVLLNFLILILGSAVSGFVGAFLATYISKNTRFLTKDRGVSETGFLFLVGFFAYLSAQLLGFSGSVTLLIYGILLSHYNIYNMSKQSRHASKTAFVLMSNISQGVLFLIMGIMVWQVQWESQQTSKKQMTHSYIFFLVILIILLIVRVFNIFVLGYLSRMISKKFTFTFEEMSILFMGGIVRGAVPFVLFSSISFNSSNKYIKNQGIVIKTTIIFVITFTSVIFNTLIPLVFKKRVNNLREEYKRMFDQGEQENKIGGSGKRGKIKQFQERYLKKMLIYNYEARKEQIQMDKKKMKEELDAEYVYDKKEFKKEVKEGELLVDEERNYLQG